MKLIELSTRRRVTIAMLAVLAVVFGLISLNDLQVNLLPDLSYPTLTVRTEYPGAAPSEIERLLTQPVEEALGVVKNVKIVKSVSRTGMSDVILEFGWGTNMDYAGLDVREKLEVLQLPLEATRPLLLRFNPSTDPILRVGLSAPDTTTFDEDQLKALRRYADEELRKRLEPVEGVAAVKISGGLEDEVQIDIDQGRIAQLGLSVERVVQRLREENVNLSGGRLEQGNERYLVRTINQFESVPEMGDLVIRAENQSTPIFLRDVATVKAGYKEREAIIRMDGREAVEIAVYKEGDGNTVEVADGVLGRLENLKEDLPDGFEITDIDDQSRFIRAAVGDVVSAAVIGGILAVLVIYLFLADSWATAIIAAAIPVSIVATFFAMDMSGISLNIMSLGGIALATGLLVDNGIVVLENISRHSAKGKSVLAAAVDGASEVGSAVIASTLTSVFVFLPLVFVQGIGGQLFRDQALTVTYALLISLFVALTLIPMLASLKSKTADAFPEEEFASREPRTKVGRGARVTRLILLNRVPEILASFVWALCTLVAKLFRMLLWPFGWLVTRLFNALKRIYAVALPWSLRHRAIVVLLALGALGGTAALVPMLGTELIPQLSQGSFNVQVKLPPGAPLAQTDRAMSRLQIAACDADQIKTIYGVAGTGNRIDANPTEAGENIGEMLIQLSASDAQTEATAMAALRSELEGMPGVDGKFSRPELFNFATPLEVHVYGYDMTQLRDVSQLVVRSLSSSDRFVDIKNSMEQGHPEIQIVFDQERAALLGLTVKEVSDQVVKKVRGEVATRYSWKDRKIDVLVRAAEEDRASLEDIRNLIVNPTSERPVTLASVADIVVTEGPAEVRRIDQERAAVISANLSYGDLGAAVAEANRLLDGIALPPKMKMNIAGQSEEMEQSFNSLMFALGLAVFLVYLVMASQFESLLHPFVILFSIPLAGVGAVAALFLTNSPISVVVFIGLIMLAGIVVNNAIVLIDLINQLREQGRSKRDAIVEAGSERLRPIVMTTLTTTLGLLPLALGFGDGAEVRAPMAITVIGGLLVSTVLTLVVIPVVYDLLDVRKDAQAPEAGVSPVGSA